MDTSSSKRKRDGDVEDEDDEDGYYDNGGFMDDEYEPHIFGTSVLPVANLPNTFEGVPQDGMEYLFTVRRERRQLPLFTRVSNPYAVPEKYQGSDTNSKCTSSASMHSIPSEEWRACFEERFRNLRANLRQPAIHISLPSASGTCKLPEMRDRDRWWAFFRGDVEWENVNSSQFHGTKRGKGDKQKRETVNNYEEAVPQRVKMQARVVYEEKLSWDQADEDGIVELSYGDDMNAEPVKVEDEGEDGEIWDKESPIPDGSDKEAEEAVLPTPRNSHSPPATVNDPSAVPSDGLGPREPTSHIISLLDQKIILHLLKFFIQWIQCHFDRSFLPPPPPSPPSRLEPQDCGKRLYNLNPSHGRWIFALLTRLDAQLSGDEISVLRNLARECVKLIKEERSSQEATSRMSPMVPCMGETTCWMIVAAVSGVWVQKDLWADAADLLGSQ